MEEKKAFDKNSIIGFALIGLILIWVMYMNPTEELAQEKESTEKIEKDTQDNNPTPSRALNSTEPSEEVGGSLQDSVKAELAKREYGAFAYSAVQDFAKDEAVTTIENDVLELKVSNKGGQIIEAKMKQHDTYKGDPVYLIKDGNADFNISFEASDGRTYNTRDLYFEPNLSTDNGNQTLSMRAKVSDIEFLEF